MAIVKPSASKLARVAREAKRCTRCPLYRNATQTVFGEGPVGARLMLVGEQPGDQEDLAGRPFVGPAGKMLDRALADAGIDREEVYVTNVVKHFKNEPRGKRRLHKKPNRYEVEVCKVWLDQEIALVRPQLVLAMGVTAASALAGKAVTLSKLRGTVTTLSGGQQGMVTIHPSSILRAPDEAGRRAAYAGLVKDLKLALKSLARLPQAARRPLSGLLLERQLLALGQRHLEGVERHRHQAVVAHHADQIDHAVLTEQLLCLGESRLGHPLGLQQFLGELPDRLFLRVHR